MKPAVPYLRPFLAAVVLIALGAPLVHAGTITSVTRQPQRFFPEVDLPVTGADPATGELILANKYQVGITGFALVGSTGGAVSTPAITRLYPSTLTAHDSGDPGLLYGVRITAASRCLLYPSRQEADTNTNPIKFSAAGKTPLVLSIANSNWCWDACTQMVLGGYGTAKDQDSIADTAFTGPGAGRKLNEPNHLSQGAYSETYNKVVYTRKGVGQLLKDIATINNEVYEAVKLTKDRIQAEMDGLRPMVFQIGYYDATNKRTGGHVFVIHGLTGDTLTLADPWPTSSGTALLLSTLQNVGYSGGKWEAGLATAKSLDLVFLIDTTGSMGPYINQVKANAGTIISTIAKNFKSYRIAVAEYRDDPNTYGDNGDYVYKVRTGFTTDAATATSAINALSASGGGDVPEAVYSGALNVLNANGLGAWRENPTYRQIIVMGDAPGHDPEVFPGGTNSAAVLAKAQDAKLPIHISGIIVGGAAEALATGNLLAGGSGGVLIDARNASDVPAAINTAITTAANNPRTPSGSVAAFKPLFTLANRSPGGMENPPKKVTIYLEKQTPDKSWAAYDHLTQASAAETGRFEGTLPLGAYRWRLGYKYSPQTILSPSGDVLDEQASKKVLETDFVQFTRTPVLPQPPTIVQPEASGFYAKTETVKYQWKPGVDADKYALEVMRKNKVVRRLTVTPTAKQLAKGIIKAKVIGHKVGKLYTWRVQSLNFDRPEIDPTAWVSR